MNTDTEPVRYGHPESCTDPDCQLSYAEHLRSIGVSAAALPNRKGDTAEGLVRDKEIDRDLDAYKRLRHSGIQPPRNQGSARWEATADHRWQIESSPRQEGES